MPQYTVRYFNVKALGETIRLLLSAAGEDFKDERVVWEDWVTQKSSSPFGQLPTLEIDGKVYAQSTAISRYLGKKYGFTGATPEEDLEIDQIVDTFHDLRSKAAAAHYEPDPEQKEKRFELVQPTFAPLLEKLDAVAAANDGHVALGKLTWGDFNVAGMYDYLKTMLRIADLDTKYPNIKKIYDNVYALPKVQAYNAKLPDDITM